MHLKRFSVDNFKLFSLIFFLNCLIGFSKISFTNFSFGSGTSKMCSSNEEMAYGERIFLR